MDGRLTSALEEERRLRTIKIQGQAGRQQGQAGRQMGGRWCHEGGWLTAALLVVVGGGATECRENVLAVQSQGEASIRRELKALEVGETGTQAGRGPGGKKKCGGCCEVPGGTE